MNLKKILMLCLAISSPALASEGVGHGGGEDDTVLSGVYVEETCFRRPNRNPEEVCAYLDLRYGANTSGYPAKGALWGGDVISNYFVKEISIRGYPNRLCTLQVYACATPGCSSLGNLLATMEFNGREQKISDPQNHRTFVLDVNQ